MTFGTIFGDFWGYGETVRMELLPARELDLEGRRGQKFDKFRFFQHLPQNVPKGVPERAFGQFGVQRCPKVTPNGYQNPSKNVQKWSLESTWYPLGSQILPRVGPGAQKVPKVTKNR